MSIAHVADEMILEGSPRESGIIDYRLGTKISVSYRGTRFGEERSYLCHTCIRNRCEHVERVQRYREEHAA